MPDLAGSRSQLVPVAIGGALAILLGLAIPHLPLYAVLLASGLFVVPMLALLRSYAVPSTTRASISASTRGVDKAILFLALFFSAGLVIPFLPTQLILAGLAGLAVTSLFLTGRAAGNTYLINYWLLIFMVLVAISPSWSALPRESADASLRLIVVSILGVYAIQRFSLSSIVSFIYYLSIAVIVITMIAVVIFPEIGLESERIQAGAWRGAFIQKNFLGRAMVLSLIVCMLRLRFRVGSTLLATFVALISFVIIVASSSDAALISAFIMISAFVIIQVFQVKHKLGLGGLGLILAGLAVPWAYVTLSSFATQAFENEAILTGRVGLWENVITAIEKQPWWGYGYGGFWHGFEGPSRVIVEAIGGEWWIPPHSHNTIMEVWLAVGAVGVVAFVLAYLSNWKRVFKAHAIGLEEQFAVLLLLFVFVHGLTERAIPVADIYWIIFVAVSLWRPTRAIASNGPGVPEHNVRSNDWSRFRT